MLKFELLRCLFWCALLYVIEKMGDEVGHRVLNIFSLKEYLTWATATSKSSGSEKTDESAVIDPLSPVPRTPILGANPFSFKYIALSMKSITWVSFLSPIPLMNQLSSKYRVPKVMDGWIYWPYLLLKDNRGRFLGSSNLYYLDQIEGRFCLRQLLW